MAIKEFFKNATKTVKSATTKVINKVDAKVDVQKLKYRISKKEEEIREIYRALGEKIVASVYAEESFDDAIAEAIASIEELEEEIEALNAERLAKGELTVCEECGAEIAASDEFCSKCGKSTSGDETELENDEYDTVIVE